MNENLSNFPNTPQKKKKTKSYEDISTDYNHGLLQKGRINHCLIQPQTSIKKMKSKIKREGWTKNNFKALKTINKNLINSKIKYKFKTLKRTQNIRVSKIVLLKQLDL